MHSNGPDGADHGWIKRTELTGELETTLEKLEEVDTWDYVHFSKLGVDKGNCRY